jgi:hypothetical protein
MRMDKAEDGSMKGQAAKAALVRPNRPAVKWTIVDCFPYEWSARLAQVNAYLVGSPCFQNTFDKGEIAKVLQDRYMRDGPLALARAKTAAAPAISAVRNEPRFYGSGVCLSPDDRTINTANGMSTKLPAEMSGGQLRPGKNN